MRFQKLKLVCLTLFATALLGGCKTLGVTIPNDTTCTASGSLVRGMICAESLTPKVSQLTLEESFAFLEPSEEEDRAGAMCMSARDYNARKTALEQACILLKKRCTYEMKQIIEGLKIQAKNLGAIP